MTISGHVVLCDKVDFNKYFFRRQMQLNILEREDDLEKKYILLQVSFRSAASLYLFYFFHIAQNKMRKPRWIIVFFDHIRPNKNDDVSIGLTRMTTSIKANSETV